MTQRDPNATTPRLRRTPPEEGNIRHTQNYMSLPFNPRLKERAKALRRAGNLSEVLLWNQLKKGQFKGMDFDRQKIIGNASQFVIYQSDDGKMLLFANSNSNEFDGIEEAITAIRTQP